MMDMVLGVITGLIFGVLLQKAEVLRFEKQVGFLLFRDMTIIQFMLSAVVVGMVGIYLLTDLGVIPFDIKSTVIMAQALGGLLFGAGWAIGGYCPGTSVGALGEGRFHAIWVVLGMLVGAAIYAHVYPLVNGSVLTVGNLGKITLPQVLHVHHWIVVSVFVAALIGVLVLLKNVRGEGEAGSNLS